MMFPCLTRLAPACAAVLSVLSLLSNPVALAQTAPPATVEVTAKRLLPGADYFFSAPRLERPRLSPNGKLLAVVEAFSGGRTALRVIDLSSDKVVTIASFSDVDVNQVQWVNDERLVFDTGDRQVSTSTTAFAPGLYTAKADGSSLRQLGQREPRHPSAVPNNAPRTREIDAEGSLDAAPESETARPFLMTGARKRMLPAGALLASQAGARGTNNVFIYFPEFKDGEGEFDRGEISEMHLLSLDTVSGLYTRTRGPSGARGWLVDHTGVARVATTQQGGHDVVHLRASGSKEWQEIARVDAFGGADGVFQPLAFGADGALYVRATNGKDMAAVYRYDTAARKLGTVPVIVTEGYDFDGSLIMRDGVLLGFRYTADAEGTAWFDPAMKALQAEIDARMPDTVNVLSVPERAGPPNVLVESYSHVRPRTFLTYHTGTKVFKMVGNVQPALAPDQLGRQQAVSYRARDGMAIPALLTLPAASTGAKAPLVVLMHDGPFARGATWGWNPVAQFLASRGYAVLEPSHRGSTGFGQAHWRAGFGQLGLGMQDDVADGARWAVAQGFADERRICAAGHGTGGYAAMMALVRDGPIFKCGINWAGMADPSLLYSRHQAATDDGAARYRQHGLPILVGKLTQDNPWLQAASPLAQAARVTQPVLLGYGGADRSVPESHGRRFYDVLRKSNSQVEWVTYPDEGHDWALPQTRIDFLTRVERFLEQHIGKAR